MLIRNDNGVAIYFTFSYMLSNKMRIFAKTYFMTVQHMETIQNEQLRVVVSPHGAELQSIKNAKGHEYLWQADPKYWGRHSPILFPVVGTLWNGTAHFGNTDTHMGRHGFARDMDFELIAKGDEQVVFALHDNEETRTKYPCHFNLAVSYKLKGNTLKVTWHVENTDDKPIAFQIGGHPAFNLPEVTANDAMHGRLQLDNTAPIRRFIDHNSGCLDASRHETVDTEDGLLAFNEDTFKNDALIFDHSQLHQVALLNPDDTPAVVVSFKSPAVGIWSPYGKNAPFICIEPWYGVTDLVDYDGNFADRYLTNSLLPGSSFMSQYTITLG